MKLCQTLGAISVVSFPDPSPLNALAGSVLAVYSPCLDRFCSQEPYSKMWWMWCYPILCTIALVSSSSSWPYHQIYPTVNETDGRSPLYFAVVLSFGGNNYKSIGALPGIQIALDYINSEPSILPGYSLHYTLTDSQVRYVHDTNLMPLE